MKKHYFVKTTYRFPTIACDGIDSWVGVSYIRKHSTKKKENVTCGNCKRTKVFKK